MSIYINKDTKVITQGITGKTGQFHTLGWQAYANGKNAFVAGVNPQEGGREVLRDPHLRHRQGSGRPDRRDRLGDLCAAGGCCCSDLGSRRG